MTSSSKTGFMRGVEWEGEIRDVAVNIIPRPKITEPEDALVRITSSAICGSDLHIYHGLLGANDVPHGIGHEAVGIVEEVGPAVDFFKPGDRVVIVCAAEDGHLVPKAGLEISRDELMFYGLGSEFGTEDGLQSTFPCFTTRRWHATNISKPSSPAFHGRTHLLSRSHPRSRTRSGFR